MWRLRAAIVTPFFVAYAICAVLRHWHFRSSGYDLGIFDQAVWHYSRFEWAGSSFTGFANILGEHFHPILMLLAPAYWIIARPETLLVLQAAIVALSLVPVFHYADTRLGRPAALMLTVAYGLFWGIQRLIAFDFHELAFAPLFIASAILAVDRRRFTWAWVSVGMLLLVKEDQALFVIALGLLMTIRRDTRAHGAAMAGAGLLWFLFFVQVVMPKLAGSSQYVFAGTYGAFGGSLPEVGWTVLTRPGDIASALFVPAEKLRTLVLWFGPWLLLPLASPLALLTLPLILERFLSASPNHWGAAFHYSAPMAPILAMAAADGLARVQAGTWTGGNRGRRTVTAATAVMLVLCAILPGRLPLWSLFSPRTWTFSAAERAGWAVMALVPGDVSVVAQDAVAPHVSQRAAIFTLRPGAPDADLVLAAPALSPWPLDSADGVARLLEERKAAGYRVLLDDGAWIVLAGPKWQGLDPYRTIRPIAAGAR